MADRPWHSSDALSLDRFDSSAPSPDPRGLEDRGTAIIGPANLDGGVMLDLAQRGASDRDALIASMSRHQSLEYVGAAPKTLAGD